MMTLRNRVLSTIVIAFSLQSMIAEANTAKLQTSTTVQTKTLSVEQIDTLAEKWGITHDDYVRYTDIMTGPMKHWNPNLDPVMVLGIYAESDAEQQRFAELLAKQEYSLVTRTQAFERAYRDAFQRFFPQAEIVSADLMKPYHARKNNHRPLASPLIKNTLTAGDRLLYFADASDNETNAEKTKADIQQLQKLLKSGSGISADIYVLGVINENAIRRWAKQQAIDIHLLNSTLLTLNRDDGAYQTVSASSSRKTPFYLQRDGELFAVSRADILAQ